MWNPSKISSSKSNPLFLWSPHFFWKSPTPLTHTPPFPIFKCHCIPVDIDAGARNESSNAHWKTRAIKHNVLKHAKQTSETKEYLNGINFISRTSHPAKPTSDFIFCFSQKIYCTGIKEARQEIAISGLSIQHSHSGRSIRAWKIEVLWHNDMLQLQFTVDTP